MLLTNALEQFSKGRILDRRKTCTSTELKQIAVESRMDSVDTARRTGSTQQSLCIQEDAFYDLTHNAQDWLLDMRASAEPHDPTLNLHRLCGRANMRAALRKAHENPL